MSPLPYLPPEIWLQIWKDSWEPRIISPDRMRLKPWLSPSSKYFRPLPVTSAINHQSRQETLKCYEQMPSSYYGLPQYCNYDIDMWLIPVRVYPGFHPVLSQYMPDSTKVRHVVFTNYLSFNPLESWEEFDEVESLLRTLASIKRVRFILSHILNKLETVRISLYSSHSGMQENQFQDDLQLASEWPSPRLSHAFVSGKYLCSLDGGGPELISQISSCIDTRLAPPDLEYYDAHSFCMEVFHTHCMYLQVYITRDGETPMTHLIEEDRPTMALLSALGMANLPNDVATWSTIFLAFQYDFMAQPTPEVDDRPFLSLA
jgi:hypothetical protein